jgi:hypothetical protein
MPSIEELNQLGSIDSVDSEGFVSEFGKTQEKVLKNFNTGVARLFGLPRVAFDLIEAGENKLINLAGIETKPTGDRGFLPTSGQIQNVAAEQGLAFEEGKEPQDTASRIIQNIGTTGPLLPLLGPAALIPELAAATAGAIGGKVVESTSFGQKHPELSRAIGEFAGGFSPSVARTLSKFYGKGGFIGAGIKLGKKGVEKGAGALPKTEARVAGRLRTTTPSPERAIKSIAREAGSPEGRFLKPGQASGDVGIAGLSRAVEEEVPEFAEQMATRRIRLLKVLERKFKQTGDVADARAFIEADLTKRANLANIALSKVNTAKDPGSLGTAAESILRRGVEKARTAESKVWSVLPSGEVAQGSNLKSVVERELRNITEGGTVGEISSFAREKLGTLKAVIKEGKRTGQRELKGGKLFNQKKPNTSAKAIHQFYSQLGRERSELTRQAGSSNKIRIIDDLRAAALDDLEAAGLSSPYTDAIKFSRELNEKFTQGAVGKILGFARGETPDAAQALNVLVGKGGQEGKRAIQQALRGAPEVKGNIEDFIKTQFAIAATNADSNNINVVAGNRFLKQFDPVLSDVFPELKSELKTAISKQSSVDELVGVGQVSQLSPLIKEKAAASIFLKANPNEEMAAIINSTSIQRTKVLKDLVKLTQQDPTGKALRGLKNGFAEEIFEHARKTTKAGDFIDGKRILSKINKLKPELINSGMFTGDDVKRFQRIGDAFEKIAFELNATATKGGIINDIPSRVLSTGLRIFGVRAASKLNRTFGGAGFGASLQQANIVSSEMRRLADKLTNDQARALLIKAVTNRDLMTDLLKDISRIPVAEGKSVVGRITSAIKGITASSVLSTAGETAKGIAKRVDVTPRAGAIVPPLVSAKTSSDDASEESINELLRLRALSKTN